MLLDRSLKSEQSTRILAVDEAIGRYALHIPTVIVDTGEFHQVQIGEVRRDGRRRVKAMRVEADALTADGYGKIKPPAGGQNPPQFGTGLTGAMRIQRIPITAEADVLGDVEAGKRFH